MLLHTFRSKLNNVKPYDKKLISKTNFKESSKKSGVSDLNNPNYFLLIRRSLVSFLF